MEGDVFHATAVGRNHGGVAEGRQDGVASLVVGLGGAVGNSYEVGSHVTGQEPVIVMNGDGGAWYGIARLGGDSAIDPGTGVPLDVYHTAGDGAYGVIDGPDLILIVVHSIIV